MNVTTKKLSALLLSFVFLFLLSSEVNADPACTAPKDCRLPQNGINCSANSNCAAGRQCCEPKACSQGSCMVPATGYTCKSEGVCTGSEQCCVSGSGSGVAIIPDDGKKKMGDYELNDFLQLAVNVAKWIESIVGSLALLMFVYGGFTLLLSQGSSDKVAKGKSIIVGAVIGLVIVFVSWAVIDFIVTGIGGGAGWNVSPK